MEKDLFGNEVHLLVSPLTNISASDEPVICSCNKPRCPHVHWSLREGTEVWTPPPPHPHETEFRHSGWAANRAKVREALIASGQPARVIDRFDYCGSDCQCYVQRKTGKSALHGWYCGHRFCRPCASAKSGRLRRRLMKLIAGRTTRFWTISQPQRQETYKEALDRLMASFTRLRRGEAWQRAVKGGAFVIESHRSEKTGFWHIHLHGVTVGQWADLPAIRAHWFQCSDGGQHVKCSLIQNPDKAVGYVLKYITKGIAQPVIDCPADLAEVVEAMRGRRMLATYGEWREVDEEGQDEKREEWVHVGSLVMLLAKARAGDEWATGVLVQLRNASTGNQPMPGESPDPPG